jgi:ATP-dependent Lon protease
MPGRLVQSIRRCGTRNPVFLLDEIDKLGNDFRGDPASALLEALDPEQNRDFSDHYLEVGFDLSRVLFITTANVIHTIPAALRDRLEIIQLPGYLHHEKMEIARNFLLPKQLREHGIQESQLEVTDEAVDRIIQRYTRESGVRSLERELGNLCRKVARQIAEQREKERPKRGKAVAKGKRSRTGRSRTRSKGKVADTIRVTEADVATWLSVPPYHEKEVADEAEVGVATGLAWTSTGGEILPIEVTLMKGNGKLILTGQLGDIMKESARAALSWVRSQSRRLGIRANAFDTQDIHVHVPEGAIPKDGPSAGLAIATAIASVASNTPVQRRVAMTGEITLRGRALPIGGLSAKVVAALRAGVHTVLLPAENEKDLAELPQHLREELRLVPVRSMDEVLEHAWAPKPRRRARSGNRRSAYTH